MQLSMRDQLPRALRQAKAWTTTYPSDIRVVEMRG